MNSEFTVTFEVLPQGNEQIIIKICNILIINERMLNINTNHKNWFRRLLIPINSLVKLLLDSLLSDTLLSARVSYRIVQQTIHIQSYNLTR